MVEDQAALRSLIDPPESLPKGSPGRNLEMVSDRTARPGNLEVDRHERDGGGAEGETLRRPQWVLRAL